MSHSWRTHSYVPAAAAALVTAAAIAACGGSSSPRSTTSHTTASARAPQSGQPGASAYRFAECMRSHGVSNFPDPQFHGAGRHLVVSLKLDPTSSPAFKSASQACRKILPPPGPQSSSGADVQRQRQDALAFSQCMRGRGFPNFPDPTAQGELNPQMVTAAGINLHQPAVLHAGLACVPVTHGLLTAADVQHAVNGNGG